MNREIKFRVWTGSHMEYKVMAGYLGHFYVAGMDEKDAACMSPFNTLYSKETPVMQYTGLKDKNGREIYEGDIIKNKFERIGWIIWSDYGFRWRSKDKEVVLNNMPLTDSWPTEPQIIGNIFESSHLLK